MIMVKTVGITGASGNIGTTLREGLKTNYQLRLYDIVNIEGEDNFTKVDFSEKEKIKGILDGVDILIHLAGDPRPDAPQKLTLKNNFMATSYVFEEALRVGVKKIIYASSNFYHEGVIKEVLRKGLRKVITLDMPPTPQCLYAQSKVFGEYVGRHLSYLGMKFIALRIGWTVPEDNPVFYDSDYMRAVFCSKRDLIQAFKKAIEENRGSNFIAAFVTSDNSDNVFDLSETKEILGFYPQDNAKDYFIDR
ncbi:MAG: NAD(P)-dependent oxidoreductase [Candidatus Omnitrophica bacterium]|nr:NAD(P)-dependent oxidoreductase [Candidatus Omnitrophota bacterium]MCM8827254.1 NAD(P)-dependent oxidoreductase [Candidatus Omnitrophota bacterium]